nr:unnamed protein product [Spirometra erinaceieuropaei]
MVNGSPGSVLEDAELVAIPRQRRQQRPSAVAVLSPLTKSKLPCLAQILARWGEKWPQRQQPQQAEEPTSDSTLRPPASSVARKEANSASMSERSAPCSVSVRLATTVHPPEGRVLLLPPL